MLYIDWNVKNIEGLFVLHGCLGAEDNKSKNVLTCCPLSQCLKALKWMSVDELTRTSDSERRHTYVNILFIPLSLFQQGRYVQLYALFTKKAVWKFGRAFFNMQISLFTLYIHHKVKEILFHSKLKNVRWGMRLLRGEGLDCDPSCDTVLSRGHVGGYRRFGVYIFYPKYKSITLLRNIGLNVLNLLT